MKNIRLCFGERCQDAVMRFIWDLNYKLTTDNGFNNC